MTKKQPLKLNLKSPPPRDYIAEGVVNPDGPRIEIHWEALSVGASVFVPAVNLHKLKNQLNQIARLKGIKLKHVERIESGKLGVRFWRMT